MAYNGQWINELVATTPLGTETKSLGDNAIREIKLALKNTFPNVTSNDAYTGTMSQLNDLVSGQTVPYNTVIMWSGLEANVPAGWTICDGRARPGGGNAPDLRYKVVMGAGSPSNPYTLHVGDTGGSYYTVVTGQTTDGHALTTSELPAHSHSVFENDSGSWGDTPSSSESVAAAGGGSSSDYWYSIGAGTGTANVGKSSTVGGNQAHTHSITIDDSGGASFSNLPPYYALYFLIKD